MFRAESLNDISNRIRGEFRTEIPGLVPETDPVALATIKVLAQLFRAEHLRLERLHRQKFASQAEAIYLNLHGIENGLSRRPATFAHGQVVMSVVPGTVIPVKTQLSSSLGTLYETVNLATSVSETVNVNVEALDPGLTGNLPQGSNLTMTAPIPDVSSIVVGPNGILGGEDEESDEEFRERILERKRNPPHGGAPFEYVEWSKQKTGVTRVWVKRATPGPGSVTIYFAMDNAGLPNGIPPSNDVVDLLGHLNDVAPGNANVIVLAPTALPVNITISDLHPDTPSVRDALMVELRRVFLRKAEPGEIFSLSWINQGISATPGHSRHQLTLPDTDIVPDPGQLPVLGSVLIV